MTKIAKNGSPISDNIYELLSKLYEKGLSEAFERDLDRYSKNKGYKATYKLFMRYVESGEPLPSDAALAEGLAPHVKNFADKKQDFYNRILDYVGRELIPKKDWFADALKVLNQVDGLWDLGLKDHAEARFMSIYKLYNTEVDYESKYWHSYVLSKISCYARYFATVQSFIDKKKEHQKQANREEFSLIADLERAASLLDVNQPKYADPPKWKKDSAEFRLFEVLFSLAKQKSNYDEAGQFLRQMENYLAEQNGHTLLRDYHGGQRIFNFGGDADPQSTEEIELAFSYYLKMERYHLCILDGDTSEAERVLVELYSVLNKTSEKSRSSFAGLLLYLKLDLQQSQYALALSGKKPDLQVLDFDAHFLATQAEVSNLEVRMEVNRLIFQFLTTPERPDLKEFEKHIKLLDKKLKGVHEIKLELELLKLLMCIENYMIDKADSFIRSVSSSANKSGRDSEFLMVFLHRVRKTDFTNRHTREKNIVDLIDDLEPKRNIKSHIDNLVMFWLGQFVHRSRNTV
jgi:hypothetical protein